MTLTFTGYDRSQERHDFDAQVKAAQGFVSSMLYPRGKSPAIVELIAFVPEQPELLCPSRTQDNDASVSISGNQTQQTPQTPPKP